MAERRFLIVLLALATTAVAAHAQGGGRNRPIALLFDASPSQTSASAAQKTEDGLDDVQRASAALRSLRRAFLDEGVIEPLLFSLETPTIARALLDAKVNLAPGVAPTEAEQLRIAAACGATYIGHVSYSITTLPAVNEETPQKVPTLELETIEVKSGKPPTPGKRWRDTMRVSDSLSISQIARREGLSDALNTAARTLVLRFLSVPALRELRRRTPSAELLPRPITPPIASDASDELPPHERAEQARLRAETILKEGNQEEGIRALRKAINLAPRALAPRVALVRVWVQLQRPDRIEEEARRALAVADPGEPAALRSELVLLLAGAQQAGGDLDGARSSFEEALAADPKNREVRLALGRILLSQGEADRAEPHFTALVAAQPDDREAALGLARILVMRGEFDAALSCLVTAKIPTDQRAMFASATFLETAMRLAARLTQNRAILEQGKLEKAAFLTAVRAQLKRAAPLQKMLTSSPPPADAPEALRTPHRHYVLAASLLMQSLTTMQTYLESDDSTAGAQSRLYLGEFFREMNEAASVGQG